MKRWEVERRMHCLQITIVLIAILFVYHVNGANKRGMRDDDSEEETAKIKRELDFPQNQDPRKKIMFWRPQKVGSSTVVNILNTYSFRHGLSISPKGAKNSFCFFVDKCAKELNIYHEPFNIWGQYDKKTPIKLRPIDHTPFSRNADISIQHQLCNMDGNITQNSLHCAFRCNDHSDVPLKQITLLREPLSRAISVYYFWGELFKLKALGRGKKLGIGKVKKMNSTITVGKFPYHGDETSPPPEKVARAFVKKFSRIYTSGMPGPSLSWSSFSNSAEDASSRFLPQWKHNWSPQVLPMILEKLDESLVLMCDYLGWPLSDAVFIKPRKHLSSHPKADTWDQTVISDLLKELSKNGEIIFYNNAAQSLEKHVTLYNERHKSLSAGMSPFDSHVSLYKSLRKRASEVCNIDSLVINDYKEFLSNHPNAKPCPTLNKLRDVDSLYIDRGHCFSLSPNSRLTSLTLDICGSCEAQAILYAIDHGMSNSVSSAPTYRDLRELLNLDVKRTLFRNCP